jgi:hypothetical protein
VKTSAKTPFLVSSMALYSCAYSASASLLMRFTSAGFSIVLTGLSVRHLRLTAKEKIAPTNPMTRFAEPLDYSFIKASI